MIEKAQEEILSVIKGESFPNNPGKVGKISYLLMPKGLEEKLRLTYHFLKVKESEYKNLQTEWNARTKPGV